MTSLRDEMERMRSEVALIQDRSRTETESLRSEVQRLPRQQRAAGSDNVRFIESDNEIMYCCLILSGEHTLIRFNSPKMTY